MRRIGFVSLGRVIALAVVCFGAIRESEGEDMLTLNFYSPTHGVLAGEVATTNWVDFFIQSTWWPDSHFFYTMDGTVPSSNSTPYVLTVGKPLRITNSLTFRAVSYNSTFTESNTRTLEFNVVEGNRDAIKFEEHRHQFTGAEVVNLFMSSKFFPHRVFYTLDGSEPTTNSATLSGYATYLELKTNVTVRVKAYNEDLSESVTGVWNVQLRSGYPVSIDTTRLEDPTLVTRNPSFDNYVSNTVVTVTATNKNGWTFKGWASGGEGTIYDTNATLVLVVTKNVSLNPVFKTRILTNVVGGGRIVAPNEAQFRETVRIEAIPDEGYYFGGWTGTLKGNTNETTMFQVRGATPEITAVFVPAGQQVTTLTARTEAGQIYVRPERDFHVQGEIVELELDLAELPSPVPTTNGPPGPKRFVGWGGDASGTENPLRVVMDRSKVIEAIVEPAYPMEQRTLSLNYSSRFPAVADDGTVYVTSDAMLYALTPDLKVKWAVTNMWFAGEAAIGASGNVYVVAENGNAVCVSPSGRELWRYVSDDPYIYSPAVSFWPRTVTITSDETLYYVSGHSAALAGSPHLYIVKDGKLVQRVDNTSYIPLAGPDDTLYVVKGSGFEAHKPFGNVKWSSPYPRPAAIDANGRLYSVSAGSNIVALDFQGEHLWTTAIPTSVSGLRIGAGGRLFASTDNGNGFAVLDTNGVRLWERAGKSVLPLRDGGAQVLEEKSAPANDPLYGFGSYRWTILRRILPDGRSGEFSTYYSGFVRPNRPVSGTQTVITDEGDVYGYWIYGIGDPFSNSTKALFHWKSAVSPEGGPRAVLAKNESGWVLRKDGITGRVVVESSTNLRDWEAMGEMDTELSIEPAAGSPRFFRLRMN